MYTPITLAPGTNSDKREFFVYSSAIIPIVWDELYAVLQPAFEIGRGILAPEQLYNWLVQEHATAFAVINDGKVETAFAVMKVNYGTYSVARVVAFGGKDLKATMRFLDCLEAWAFVNGCVEIEGWCRPSMTRALKRYGFEPKLNIVSRDLRRKLQ